MIAAFFQEPKICYRTLIEFLTTSLFFSWLKPNNGTYEVAGTDVMNWVKVALSGMKNIDLKKHSERSRSLLYLQQNLKLKIISKII